MRVITVVLLLVAGCTYRDIATPCARGAACPAGDPQGDTQGGAGDAGDAWSGDARSGDAPEPGDPSWSAPSDTVFYSVGQNLDDHKTGTPTVTVQNGVATFSEPQTAPNMGVGDAIFYDSSKCQIASKVSATVWRCTDVAGGYPPNTTDTPVVAVRHVFDSLAAAINQLSSGNFLGTNDLVAAGLSVGLPCYSDAGGADTIQAIVTGYTTGPSARIRIFTPSDTATECNQSQRHAGVWDDSKYRLVVGGLAFNEAALKVQVRYTWVDGLQVDASGPENIDGIGSTGGPAGHYFYSNNLIVGHPEAGSQNSDGICIHGGAAGQVVRAWNNIIVGFNLGSSQASAIYASEAGITVIAYNNTAVDCDFGIYQGSGTVVIAKNNLVHANDQGFRGSYDGASDYNVSNTNDAPGPHSQGSAMVSFAGVGDYHLNANDGVARDAGENLAADSLIPFDTDIDGEPRVGAWDIGADEVP